MHSGQLSAVLAVDFLLDRKQMLPVHLSLAIALLSFNKGAHEGNDLLKVRMESVSFKISDLTLENKLELTFNHQSILLGQIWSSHCHHRVDDQSLEDEVICLDWLPLKFHLT